jgi:hypothetical protein
MTTIPPTTASAVGVTPAGHDDPAVAHAETAPAPPHADAAHPLARFTLNDMHPAVQAFADFAPHDGGNADALLARYAPQGGRHGGVNGSATPLHQKQVPPGTGPTQPLTAAPRAVPGAPIDLKRMEELNKTVQKYDVKRSPVDADDLRETQRKFKGATEALKAGDYKTAEQALRSLGFPLPQPGSGQKLSYEGALTAIMLGVPVHPKRGGGWEMAHVDWGKRGFQPLNDVNGFAANAIMINRMAAAPGGASNPPTEAQATAYMRDLAKPAQGKPPTPQAILQAASEITNGSIMHYSSAGASDPKYGDNPNPRAYYKDASGRIHEFASLADAQKAAREGEPPIERKGKITPILARSPDTWSDITSQGTRAGRYIGDCESKVFMQTRLLTEAGFKSLGSVDVQPEKGPGHMFGAFRAPDGTVWITSNEEFHQVKASDAKAGVTQADVETKLRELTAEIYHVQPNYKGELDLSGFTFAAAATAHQSGANAATDTIRRSTELGQLGRSETFIPPPPAKTPPPPRP